jgi:hypothetical protein
MSDITYPPEMLPRACGEAAEVILHKPDGSVWVIGRVSGRERAGDQVPGMPGAICHACGLGYRCADEDCPNDRPNPIAM